MKYLEEEYESNKQRENFSKMLKESSSRSRISKVDNADVNGQQSWTEYADSVLDRKQRSDDRRSAIKNETNKRADSEKLIKKSERCKHKKEQRNYNKEGTVNGTLTNTEEH